MPDRVTGTTPVDPAALPDETVDALRERVADALMSHDGDCGYRLFSGYRENALAAADAVMAVVGDDQGPVESERDTALATITAIYRWLVDELDYGLDMHTKTRPAWLDVTRLAEEWRRHEHAEDEPVEQWIDLIYAETGWREDRT